MFATLLAFPLWVIPPNSFDFPNHERTALVYKGQGTCNDGCAKAAAQVARRAGFKVKYIGLSNMTSEALAAADLWVQPGGDAIELAMTYGPAKLALLRDYIARGGKYLGFCAGAFLTDSTVDDAETVPGLGLFPGTTFDYFPSSEAMILPLDWHGAPRDIYYQEGPAFRLESAFVGEVVARYASGAPATIQFPYGRGKVSIAGPHPEAPEDWKDSLHDSDGSDFDLADQMVDSLFQ